MTYKLTIDQNPTYLHATVTGRNSRENVARYLDEILRECTAPKCFRVLIEERPDGPRLGTLDVFQLVAEGSSRAKGISDAIAYVDVNAAGSSTQFAETVAINRTLPVAVFSTVSEVKEWLLKKDRGSTEPHAAEDADQPRG